MTDLPTNDVHITPRGIIAADAPSDRTDPDDVRLVSIHDCGWEGIEGIIYLWVPRAMCDTDIRLGLARILRIYQVAMNDRPPLPTGTSDPEATRAWAEADEAFEQGLPDFGDLLTQELPGARVAEGLQTIARTTLSDLATGAHLLNGLLCVDDERTPQDDPGQQAIDDACNT